MVVGVPRRVEHLEFELLPLEGLPLSQAALNIQRRGKGAAQFIGVWMFQDVGHVFITPDPGAVMLLQVRQSIDVVVVVMAGHRQVDLLHAKAVAQDVQVVLQRPQAVARLEHDIEGVHEGPARRAVVDKEGFAAVADDDPRVRASGDVDQMRQYRVRPHVEGWRLDPLTVRHVVTELGLQGQQSRSGLTEGPSV